MILSSTRYVLIIQDTMRINIIKEKKFKNILMSIRFRTELQQDTMAEQMLLSDILSNVCEKYPDKQAVMNRLNELYGASFSSNYMTYGKSQIIELRAKVINSVYVQEPVDLLAEMLEFIKAFLYHPLKDGTGIFDTGVVEEAKRIALSKLARNIDEPSQYCSLMALKQAGQTFPLGIQSIDQVDNIKRATPSSLTKAYEALWQDANIDVLVVGDVDERATKRLLTQLFSSDVAEMNASSYAIQPIDITPYTCEYRDISQAYITMVYQTNIKNTDADFWKLQVANAIFGQTPSSLLFREVREKHSLCYSIHASLLAYDGALMVNVGVAPENVDKTIALIKQQFTRVATGDFDLTIMDTVKAMLSNMLINQQDDLLGILNFAYRNVLLDAKEQVADMIEKINAVTLNDVQTCFAQCNLVTTFVLGKEGKDEGSSK